MNGRIWRAAAVAGMVVGFGVCAAPASAQATRTWVSGTGDDANPCSRTAPCKTFASAISKTATGGVINCLDPAGFGAVTITKSISIVCEAETASILSAGTRGITVNAAANSVVTISGLDIDGVGTGTDGIYFLNGGSLLLDNVRIRNVTGFGIRFEPNAAATLTVKNVIVSNSGAAATALSGGLLARPAAGIGASVTIADTQFVNNQNVGARVETQGGSTVNATFVHSLASNSGTGLLFRSPAGTGTINATVNGVTVTHNASYGVIGNGPALSLRVGDSTIAANGTGVFVIGGAAVTSFGDNRLVGNTTNGAFPAVTPKQ